jgi:hypothetical protein
MEAEEEKKLKAKKQAADAEEEQKRNEAASKAAKIGSANDAKRAAKGASDVARNQAAGTEEQQKRKEAASKAAEIGAANAAEIGAANDAKKSAKGASDVATNLANFISSCFGFKRQIQEGKKFRTRTNTLPMAVGTRGERRRLSPKTSARACAVWCNAMTARFRALSRFALQVACLFVHRAASSDTKTTGCARYTISVA